MTCFDFYSGSDNLDCVFERTPQVISMKNEIETGQVRLKATVTAIRPARGPHPHLMWLITFQVNAVIAGDYSEPTFSLHIHSPDKSGIVVGGQYVVELSKINADEYALKAIEPCKQEGAS